MKKVTVIFISLVFAFIANAKTYVASQNCINHIKKYETCSLTSYPDADGYSIGWGHHTPDVKANQKISQKKADEYLAADIATAEKYANALLKSLPYKFNFSQGFFDGLVSLVYNCGYGGVKKTKFYSALNRCRVKNGVMNKSDFNYTVSFVRSTNITGEGHKPRRKAEMNMMLN
jgi:lysozyme